VKHAGVPAVVWFTLWLPEVTAKQSELCCVRGSLRTLVHDGVAMVPA
jgi:hypothetical protein